MTSEDILTLAPPKADERIAYGNDANQFLDLRLPKMKPEFPLVINIHGGFWRAKYDLEHAGHLCAALTAKGFATANLEYRRAGNPGGGWPGSFSDIRAAYQYLLQHSKQLGFDTNRILVMGHSAGGQLALCLAAHERSVKKVVSLAGVVDLKRAYELHLSHDAVVEFLGGTPSAVPEHYREADPMQLAIPDAQQWLIHGYLDDTVPPAFSGDYVNSKREKKEDVHLSEIAGADHYDLINPHSAAWKEIEHVVMQSVS